jgi:hypothetical protein
LQLGGSHGYTLSFLQASSNVMKFNNCQQIFCLKQTFLGRVEHNENKKQVRLYESALEGMDRAEGK